MFRHGRHPIAFAAILAAGVFATVAHAADSARERASIRLIAPVNGSLHHSGGYVPLPRGDVLVGSIEKTTDPASWSPFSTVGYYDDGPNCTIRGLGVAFFFAPHFARVCRTQ